MPTFEYVSEQDEATQEPMQLRPQHHNENHVTLIVRVKITRR